MFFCPDEFSPNSSLTGLNNTLYTHTHFLIIENNYFTGLFNHSDLFDHLFFLMLYDYSYKFIEFYILELYNFPSYLFFFFFSLSFFSLSR